MAKLFRRRCRLVVAAPLASDYKTTAAQTVDITSGNDGLRVQFKIEKTLDKSPNTSEIKVTNLSDTSRASFSDKGARVVLLAGYEDTIAQVFFGDARTIDHARDERDWVTTIRCGDGERGYQFARVNASFAGGSKLFDVIGVAAQKIGVDFGSVTQKLGNDPTEFVNGYVMSGRASKELDRVLIAAGYEWSIQDGRLQVLKPGEANTERVVVLGPETGLIGSPAIGSAEKKAGAPVLKFKALLSPDLRPGCRVEFTSARHQGMHRVTKVTHTGDTRGDDWYTEGEAELLTTATAAPR